jgi:tripartite-type tricarboxylate transporter receptor subunit TctC
MLQPQLPFDPARDLCLLSLLTTAPQSLVVPAELPSGAAFFEAAVQQGERWNYGSVGAGSVAHLGMELLKLRVPGLQPVHVPYPSNPAVITGLLGGQIQMALMPPGLAMPHVRSGRLRIIGLTGDAELLRAGQAGARSAAGHPQRVNASATVRAGVECGGFLA